MIRTCAAIAWLMAFASLPVVAVLADRDSWFVIAPLVAAVLFIVLLVLLPISSPAFRITWRFLLRRIAELADAIRGHPPEDDPD